MAKKMGFFMVYFIPGEISLLPTFLFVGLLKEAAEEEEMLPAELLWGCRKQQVFFLVKQYLAYKPRPLSVFTKPGLGCIRACF